MRASSITCGVTASSPRTMLTSVGKKQISAAITTLAVSPPPKISTRIGAIARIGTVLMKTAIGKKAFSTVLLWTKAIAISTAPILPTAKPSRLSNSVGQKLRISSGKSLTRVRAMSLGAGAI